MKHNAYILEMKDICKSFPGVRALDHVDFRIKKGKVHCLIGANGAGKSTLIKILAGAYQADSGTITLNGSEVKIPNPQVGRELGISVIYQELSLIDELTVAENIFLGRYPQKNGLVDWQQIKRKSQELIKTLGVRIDVNSRVGDLSIGYKQITELAKALACEAQIIVMDEPSATLSQDEFETLVKVINDLKARGITVIYISHRLEELFTVGDAITVLRDGTLVGTKDIKELNRDQLIEMMIGHQISEGNDLVLPPCAEEKLLEFEAVENKKLKSVSFGVSRGEIVGLYGLVGSGRTEILRAIFGADAIIGGALKIDGQIVKIHSPVDALKLGIGLIPEQRKTQGLVVDLSVYENTVLPSLGDMSKRGVIDRKNIFHVVQQQVENLRIKTPCITTTVKNLSGGNQQKVVIAKWLVKNSRILLFDEPTQGIDVGAKEEVYGIIASMAGKESTCTIVASSELQELLVLCHRILVLYEGKIVGEFMRSSFNKEKILHCAITGGVK